MKLRGRGKFIIVDVEQTETSHGNITVVEEDVVYVKGKVVACGAHFTLGEDTQVIVSLEHAKSLGLGYPDSYKVVDGDKSLVAVLEPDEEKDE